MLGPGFGLKGSLVGSAAQAPTPTRFELPGQGLKGKDDGWLAERSVVL